MSAARAQAPVIRTIDFYGIRKASAAGIRQALGVNEGDALPRSKADVEQRIENVRGVVRARLEAACCEDGGAILYVGIEETGAPHFDYRAPPAGDAALPEAVVKAYHAFLAAVQRAARAGNSGEDLSRGHSLMADPGVRALQERFAGMANEHLAKLRAVLRESADEQQRAIAAYVIGYAASKDQVAADLLYALQDPDDTVRANALRALAAIAVFALKHPEAGVRVQPAWLIEMLNSLIWTDRNNAAVALVTLTETRDPDLLAQLRQRALPALVDMARWKHLAHALPAYILVGRIAAVPEKQLQAAWSSNNRETVIRQALAKR